MAWGGGTEQIPSTHTQLRPTRSIGRQHPHANLRADGARAGGSIFFGAGAGARSGLLTVKSQCQRSVTVVFCFVPNCFSTPRAAGPVRAHRCPPARGELTCSSGTHRGRFLTLLPLQASRRWQMMMSANYRKSEIKTGDFRDLIFVGRNADPEGFSPDGGLRGEGPK